MKNAAVRLMGGMCALVLVGCATPQIEAGKFAPPKTVVIADFPDLNPVATIQVVVTNWPAAFFTQRFDGFFATNGVMPPQAGMPDNSFKDSQLITNQIVNSPQSVSVKTGAAMGAAGGLVAGFINASAEETQKRAAEFPKLVSAKIQGDMRADVMKALRSSLEAKGIQTRVFSESRNAPMRLYWPAQNEKGEALQTGPFANTPPVDADLLVQIAPVAIYAAPGPLNSYHRRVGIGLAMFDGRTRKFIGWQAFPFKTSNDKFEYAKYDSLVADLDKAGPALRNALMSLVPQVSDAISGGKRQ